MEQHPLQTAFELHRAGRLSEAEAIYRQILSQNPDDPFALQLLGVIAGQKGDANASIDLFRRAIQIKPDFARAHYELANALLAIGKTDDAIATYNHVIQLQPDYADAHNNLGAALKSRGRIDEAAESYRRAIALNPARAQTHYNLGNVLKLSDRLDEAIASYQTAIQLKPDYADAHNNLALVLTEQGRLDDAIEECRLALRLKPGNRDSFTNLLYALHHHPNYDAPQILEETKQWAHLQPVFPRDIPATPNPDPNRRLKIAYLSPFFGMCADAHFILPLLAHHDRTQFEIFCYSRTTGQDEITVRMKTRADHWFDIRNLPVQAAVELIRKHRIDTLVGIARPADECLTIMASRPAPLQIVWLTFASCTTGLPSVDYRISDPFLDPPEEKSSAYSEKTLRLPETAWCYDPLIESPPSAELPALKKGFITFGSMNRFSKINPDVIVAWAEILRATPNSRLIILAIPGTHRNRLLDQFISLGINPARIEFINRQSRLEYLNQFNRIDITLDTFPFGGHTTTFDSLWMGVPVVTLAGQTSVGRAAASALQNLELQQWIGTTPDDYISIAIRLSQRLPNLANLRATLRQKMKLSPLMVGPRFARQMENIYHNIASRPSDY